MKGRRQDQIVMSGKHLGWLATWIRKEREPIREWRRRITRQHPSTIWSKRERGDFVLGPDQQPQGCTITGLPEPNGLIATSRGQHRTAGMKGDCLYPIIMAT
jgi:hypothetical protein